MKGGKARHSRRCSICNSSKRDAIDKDIEEEILTLPEIVTKYDLTERSLNTHVKALFDDEDGEEVETKITPDTPIDALKKILQADVGRITPTHQIAAAKALETFAAKDKDSKTLEEEAVLEAIKALGELSDEKLDEYIKRTENLIKTVEGNQNTETR